jgi:hypothetical protein
MAIFKLNMAISNDINNIQIMLTSSKNCEILKEDEEQRYSNE